MSIDQNKLAEALTEKYGHLGEVSAFIVTDHREITNWLHADPTKTGVTHIPCCEALVLRAWSNKEGVTVYVCSVKDADVVLNSKDAKHLHKSYQTTKKK